MSADRLSLLDLISRLESHLELQTGRVGAIQRQLDEQRNRLASVGAQLDHTAARIDALLGRAAL